MSGPGEHQGQDRPAPAHPILVLGFARGVSPSKWVRRWEESQSGDAAQELRIVPLDPSGRPPAGTVPDVLLERADPSARPGMQSETDDADSEGTAPRRAVRLYTESVALVVAQDHPLAGEPSMDRDALALVPLLDHPGHAAAWPDPEPWADPAWMPADVGAALELVATGAGAILLPLPLARHLASKRAHAIIPVHADPPLPGTEIWATWAAERDAADVQHLVAILRGRTSRSGRTPSGRDAPGAGNAGEQDRPQPKPRNPRTPSKPALPKNSRGAQLAAARAGRKKRRGR